MAVANTQVPAEVSPVASRLYRTTRPLYLQVTRALDQLGAATVGSATTAVLIALYVTGLVLLDARPTQPRVTRVLPGRCHDARNRLLRATPWSTRGLLSLLIAWARRAGMPGYVCLDDVVVERPSPGGCRGPGGPPRSAAVVCCRPALQDPGRVPAVATQAGLRPTPLPDQPRVGCGDAHRTGRRPAAFSETRTTSLLNAAFGPTRRPWRPPWPWRPFATGW
jgi:hypothetical protein